MSIDKALAEVVAPALDAIGLSGDRLHESLEHVAQRMARVLGVSDLVKEQRGIPPEQAELAVQTYAASVALAIEDVGARWVEGAEFDRELCAAFGVRKFIIAAGRSSRFSPTELIHKQIARPDGSSTNIAHARLAARLGTLDDVVVVDPMVAYKMVAQREMKPFDRASAIEYLEACLLSTSGWGRNEDGCIAFVREHFHFARHPQQQDDFAYIMRVLPSWLREAGLEPARDMSETVGFVLATWLVEDGSYLLDDAVEDYCGPGCTIAVAPPFGPGAAYMAGVERLKHLGSLDAARYSFCIYSDYPAFILDDYPNIYLNAYLRAVNRFELQDGKPMLWPEMPVITCGAKQPPDTVRDRGNIILEDTPLGIVPKAIREWRDMTEAQRAEAEQRFESKQHAINAAIFVIDTQWAVDQFDLIRKKYNHPDPRKGKAFEYWYTDLVAIAAKQDAPRRVLMLGERAPLGNKDVPSTLAYRDALHAMMRRKLLALGVWVEPGTRVNVVVREPNVGLDQAVDQIFFGGVQDPPRRVDQVFISGEVEIDSRARIEAGVVLDGRCRPVVLKGKTRVGKGVCIRGVVAEDAVFEPCEMLDGYSYEPPRLGERGGVTLVEESRLTKCEVASGATVERSTLVETRVAGRVKDCELTGAVVAADETLTRVVSPE